MQNSGSARKISDSSQQFSAGREIQTLEFRNLSFRYDQDQYLFYRLNLNLPMGQIVNLHGDVGSGQSTLLKLISVMKNPSEGSYCINGLDVSQMSFDEFLPFRLQIGYTFDYGGLFTNKNLFDNLALGPMYHGISDPDELARSIEYLAERFGFKKHLNYMPAVVPGGLRKLICVLRPLLMFPKVLTLDDPTTGLDVETSEKLMKILKQRHSSGEIPNIFFSSQKDMWRKNFSTQVVQISSGIADVGGVI
jgi:phospholipid/cholesterol/gamma-HCH transport system ATP-binding protein